METGEVMDILQEAINKALTNGWKPVSRVHTTIEFKDGDQFSINTTHGLRAREYTLEELIYDHAFLKALWPETHESMSSWVGRGRDMMLSDDPVAYLGRHLDV